MRVGICGFPGSGRSTVFAALAPGGSGERDGVAYGNIEVPDDRVDRLTAIYHPKKTTYATITFVDVGGGGGTRGAFPPTVLQHMRNMDVLVHVVRVFDNPMLAEPVDPARDVRMFEDELILLDHGIMEKRLERYQKERASGIEVDVTERCVAHLDEGHALRTLELTDEERATLQGIQLLSRRPLITLYNLSEEAWEDPAYAGLREPEQPHDNQVAMAMCGELEAEIAQMDPEEQAEMLEGLGLGEPARNPFIRQAYALLDLISFLTSGEDECRAWTVRRGANARRAGRAIHTDIERGFIRAEVHRLEDLEEHGSEAELKKVGKLRVEGKDYVVQDGDILHFRFNV